jgi:HlyD family secretion protein
MAKGLIRVSTRSFSLILLVAALTSAVSGTASGQSPNGRVSAKGRIEGGEVLSLGTSATGTVSELVVKAGQRVQAGQPLLRIDCRDLEGEVAARQSDLAASEAAFARATHGSRLEEIAIGEANVNLAEARLHEAQKAFDRAQALHEGVTVTRVQIDQAERDARMASAMLEEVRAKLTLLKVGSREEDIAEARARRDAAKGRLDEAVARVAYCTVVAPISGTIQSIRVSRGQLVSTMAPMTLITMADDGARRVRAFVSERDVPQVCPGEQAQITVDGAPGVQSTGLIENIAPDLTENPFEPVPARFHEVTLSLSSDRQIPIGSIVSVSLAGCPGR